MLSAAKPHSVHCYAICEDGKHLGGRLLYSFPLREAQEQGYFAKIIYISVLSAEDPDRAEALPPSPVSETISLLVMIIFLWHEPHVEEGGGPASALSGAGGGPEPGRHSQHDRHATAESGAGRYGESR